MTDEPREPEVRWAKRATFAEVAEALGMPTDSIAGMMSEHEGETTVLYSRPDDEHDPPAVFARALRRDAVGILRAEGEPREIPGMLEDVKRRVEGELAKRHGKPPKRKRGKPPKRKRGK